MNPFSAFQPAVPTNPPPIHRPFLTPSASVFPRGSTRLHFTPEQPVDFISLFGHGLLFFVLVQGLVNGHPYSGSHSNLGSERVPQAMPMHVVTGGLEPTPRRIADESFRSGV